MKKILIMLIVLCFVATSAMAYNKTPGKGKTINPARATWSTGFFQEALVRKAFEELGYKVKAPKDLANPIFYKSVTLGDVDYCVNGWFPIHNAQMPKNFHDKAGIYGYVVKAGGMQGYLASKKYIEKYNITSLADFKRPEVKKAFDTNGDGKADLVACPPGWGCEKTIGIHMKEYGLENDINLIKATYSASMAGALAKHKNGEPVLFYTWTPNWTVFKFLPGEDVLWINVPEIKPHEGQKGKEKFMVVKDAVGTVTNPVKLGFVVSDIRAVANKKFIAENPAIEKFLEVFTLPLKDISEQNTKMNAGEKSKKDIKRHVADWIKANQAKFDGWLEEARKAAK